MRRFDRPAPAARAALAALLAAAFAALLASALAAPCAAEVVRLEIRSREPFAQGRELGSAGSYVELRGRLHVEVDPALDANRGIVDLDLAPRNARGRVELWTDFCLLAPADPARGKRRLIYDVNNRGNKLILGAFGEEGGNDPRPGNGFLFRQGYSVLWCGWNGDVREGDGRLLIGLPVARNGDRPIRGRIHAEIVTDSAAVKSLPLAWGNSDPYPVVDPDTATVTMRERRSEPAVAIPRDRFAFARLEGGDIVPDPRSLFLHDGFRPGWIYEIVYDTQDPRVTGLGFAAVRDAVAFFRREERDRAGIANPLATARGIAVEKAYVFGISQSARFIHHLIHAGFNGDEQGRIVFDGALAHVGGGGRGLFNSRFAQTTRHGSPHEDLLSPSDSFPFTSTAAEDPLTGERGDIFERARAAGQLPKVFFTETSTEYWCRAASLLHTDVEGRRDVPLDPAVRLYFIAGGQHGVSSSLDRGIYENPRNILDHRPVLRALLVALDEWVTSGREPPPSAYPRIDDGTLVDVRAWRDAFPRLPRLRLPETCYAPLRLDHGPRWRSEGIADIVPPLAGAPYRTLVPAVDADGNERAGIRLPDVAAPLAAFSGWNTRSREAGAEGALGRFTGSTFPFARDRAERQSAGDPRPSILERYPTRHAYVARVAAEVVRLAGERFLLDEDAVRILKRAAERRLWDDGAATESGTGPGGERPPRKS